MPLQDVLEEIDSLRAIFCQDGEFELQSNLPDASDSDLFSLTFTINAKIDVPSKEENGPKLIFSISISFTVDCKYPDELKNVSLKTTCLSRKRVDEIRTELLEYVEKHLKGKSEPMVLEIVHWIEENSHRFVADRGSSLDKELSDTEIKSDLKKCMVLRLDHMRAKQKYIKSITKWMEEFNLMGRLIFFKRSIWILVLGDSGDVKEYIKCHKTQNVDVDSSGKPCKEKMLSVLFESDTSASGSAIELDGFKVVECQAWKEVDKEFLLFNLDPKIVR